MDETIWTFDLKNEADPVRRGAIHGLWRLLHYGEGDDRYPGVKQENGLSWTITGDSRIEIRFTDPMSLNALMQCQMGDFRDGLAVPPGYEGNVNHEDAYATGIYCTLQGAFKSMAGASRGTSLSGKKDETQAWVKAHGHQPVTAIACGHEYTKLQNGEWVTVAFSLTVNPWKWDQNLRIWDPPGLNEAEDSEGEPVLNPETGEPVMKVTKGGWKKTGSVAIHPALAKWNDKAIKMDPQSLFLLSFGCINFIACSVSTAAVGLSPDGPDFSSVDVYHKRWIRNPLLKTCHLDARTALWAVAAVVELPKGSYPWCGKESFGIFDTSGYTTQSLDRIYAAINNTKTRLSPLNTVAQLQKLNTRPVSDKPGNKTLFLTQIVRNLERKVPFYMELERVPFKINPNMANLLTKPEEATFKWMKDLSSAVFNQLIEAGHSKDSAGKRTVTLMQETNLRRARNRAGILDAINRIQAFLNVPKTMPADVQKYIWDRAGINPLEVRALLIFACNTLKEKKAVPDKTAPTASFEPDEFEPDDVSDSVPESAAS